MTRRSLKENKKFNGIWFFGLAGAGKTFATLIGISYKEKPFIIDGDAVRKYISFDLGHSSSDRDIQLKRVLSLAKIAVINQQIPVVSKVIILKKVLLRCSQLSFKIKQIIRPIEKLNVVRGISETQINIVGKDIQQKDFGVVKIHNNGDQNFVKVVENFVG